VPMGARAGADKFAGAESQEKFDAGTRSTIFHNSSRNVSVTRRVDFVLFHFIAHNRELRLSL
jgi:hypothetical protein